MVFCLFEDKQGRLWMGTLANGIKYLDFKSGRFNHIIYGHDLNEYFSNTTGPIISFLEDSYGVLWIWTYGKGLNRLDQEDGQFIHYKNLSGDSTSLSQELGRYRFLKIRRTICGSGRSSG
ncbi:MAG: hypothetical protein H6558_03550 [Lewinellaceae bacterium]|nr:hypothetical protein [Lewinellaceae bacterium]